MDCSKCGRDVANSKNTVKCVECGSTFHVTCSRIRTVAKLSAMSPQALATWKCDGCGQETASAASGKSDSEDNKICDILRVIQRDMAANQDSSNQNFNTVNQQLSNMNQTLNELKDKILVVERENASLKQDLGHLKEENVILRDKANSLEMEIEDLKQYSRNRNIEIRGIPLTKNENVYLIMESIARALGINFNRGDISIAHRLPAPRKKSFPPSIVAQFVSRSTRAEWMEAARDNPIQTTDVAASLRPSPVLLIDHLTPRNRRLLGYAKTIVKEGRLAYAWSKEGKIKIRKTPDGPVKTIRDNSEVDEFAGPALGEGGETVVSGNGEPTAATEESTAARNPEQ